MLVSVYKKVRIIKISIGIIALALLCYTIFATKQTHTPAELTLAVFPTHESLTAAKDWFAQNQLSLPIGLQVWEDEQRSYLVPPTQDYEALQHYLDAILATDEQIDYTRAAQYVQSIGHPILVFSSHKISLKPGIYQYPDIPQYGFVPQRFGRHTVAAVLTIIFILL